MIPFSVDFGILILCSTVIAFLFYKIKQPTLVAYLITGFVLGPAGIALVDESFFISILSELGLAFLLFFVGIEMNLKELEDLLWPLVRIGGYQTVLQTALAFAVAWLVGFTSLDVLIIALCTVFGATPVVVKLLADKGELGTVPGRIDVGVLVLQDLYIIALLAILGADSLGSGWIVAWSIIEILILIAGIALIALLFSKKVLPSHFEEVSGNTHAFFIHSIAWAFLFISASLYLDLSLEIGAFLAGLGLGQIAFRGEVKERVRPLTTFFMVVFFSSIGLGLDRSNLTAFWSEALLSGVILGVGNFFIMYWLILREGFSRETSFLGSINMTQVSEFSLVVGGLAVQQGYVSSDILGYLSVMAISTMAVSAILIYNSKKLYPYFTWLPGHDEGAVAPVGRRNHTVVFGFSDAVELLLPHLPQPVTIADNKSETLQQAEGHEVVFGNVFHEAIRNKVGVKHARLVISTISSVPINKHILQEADDDAIKIVKADTDDEASELYDLGADYVILKTMMMGDRLTEVVSAFLRDREQFELMKKKDLAEMDAL